MTYCPKYLNETEILNCIRILANSNDFFKSLYNKLSDCSRESEAYLYRLEKMQFKDISEIMKHYE